MHNGDKTARRPEARDEPIEEWTDSELLDHYRYLLAEFEDVDQGDNGPVIVARRELERRGLEIPQQDEGDAGGPGRDV